MDMEWTTGTSTPARRHPLLEVVFLVTHQHGEQRRERGFKHKEISDATKYGRLANTLAECTLVALGNDQAQCMVVFRLRCGR